MRRPVGGPPPEIGDPERLREGWNDLEGERIFFVSNPGQGLWAYRGDFAGEPQRA